jgi:hypothetical protein
VLTFSDTYRKGGDTHRSDRYYFPDFPPHIKSSRHDIAE